MNPYFPRMTQFIDMERFREEHYLNWQLRKIASDLMIDTMFALYMEHDIGFGPIHEGVVTNQGTMVKAMVDTAMKVAGNQG
jgi:hypothetical protein